MRLDKFLAVNYPEHSRATWAKFIEGGYVSVNGKVETSGKREIKGHSNAITFKIPPKPDFSKETLPVIFENDNVLVIDKPAGVLTHQKGSGDFEYEFTVAEFVKNRVNEKSSRATNGGSFRGTKSDGDFVNDERRDDGREECPRNESPSPLDGHCNTNRAGIVHRLDRATSGVIITAKNPATAKFLGRQFAERKTHKTYLAVVEARPKNAEARIDAPIGRNPREPSTFRVDPNGKSAVTNYKVLATDEKTGHALVELRPETGRTHQLRVHMAFIGSPIVGDRVYNSTAMKEEKRMMLHAWKLEITVPLEWEYPPSGHLPKRPTKSERMTFIAQIPEEFKKEFNGIIPK
jgi:23S rRNA pseudouridine1911/1915/1917 synthase